MITWESSLSYGKLPKVKVSCHRPMENTQAGSLVTNKARWLTSRGTFSCIHKYIPEANIARSATKSCPRDGIKKYVPNLVTHGINPNCLQCWVEY